MHRGVLGYLFILAISVACATAGALLGNKFNNQSIKSREVSTENYICVIPETLEDSESKLPCRVKMREDVYIQNVIDTAPKD